MRVSRLDRAIPLGLAAASFALALAQRPGWATSDTKIDLHVSADRFLGDVASVWAVSGSLGHVQGGQYGGYLLPMGPFFWLGHALGVAPWVVHRLWLGTLLALAAWGTVKLMDDLAGRPRGVVHAVAGAMIVLNPYVVVFSGRTSIMLLALAALPWLLVAVHRGLRRSRSWWWPAAFALVLTASGGGVNAALTAWLLIGAAALSLYEALFAGVPWADVRRFALRVLATTAAASMWWAVPVLTQARYGIDFLEFTEQQGTIWGTTSMSETLRLMGYWVSYIGVGFHGATRPYFADGGELLFASAVVAAQLLVPALVLGAFAWTRHAAYGPFFLALVLGGALVMGAGFPEGTPLRDGLNFTYNHIDPVHFLRTTYKAGPLVALGLAGLGGLAAGALWGWAAARRPSGRALRGAALAAGVAALLAVGSLPLVRGDALDDQLLWKEVPAAWTRTGDDLDRTLPRNTRAVLLPGELFAFYRWGGTFDSILPPLTERPVAVRSIVPYADLHAIDAFWTVDGLVGQERLVPGQLGPLLRLLGAGAVIANADGDISRSGQPPPARSARVLAAQGLDGPDRAYGRVRALLPPAGEVGPAVRLADVRRYDLPRPGGIVRVESLPAPTVVDGSADAVAGLAAFGALPARGALVYAADRDAAALRRAAAEGGEVVVSDSNRRRIFVASRLEQNHGWTLGAADEPSEDAAMLNPFPGRGAAGQTVAVLGGARSLRMHFSPGVEQFPEHRPYAAFDGDPTTAWLADRALEVRRRWLRLDFDRVRDVPYVDVLPENDRYGAVRELEIAGRRFRVHPGWNRLRLGLRGAPRLRVRITDVDYPPGLFAGGAGGLYEVRVPGLRVREALRPPVLAERALAGRDLSHTPLTYLFHRTTGDFPFRRGRFTGPPQALLRMDRGDGEAGLERVFRPPAARAFRADAWVTVAPGAPDDVLDRLAGWRGPDRFESSSRFEGLARWRASGAFDRDPGTAWLGQWVERAPAWISWSLARAVSLRRLVLSRPPVVARFPTRVRLSWPGGRTGALAVAAGGVVSLPRAARARRFRLDVLAAAFPPDATPQERTRRAVGIGAVNAVGLPLAQIPRAGSLPGACRRFGRVAGQALEMRVTGAVAALDAGTPLRAVPCGRALTVPGARVALSLPSGLFRVAWLRLRSPAPDPVARPAAPPGRVLDPGDPGRGRHDGVRLSLREPALLVLGESYNRGWRAWCDGRSLGAPQVVDGYANGWRAPASCHDVRFALAPQRPVVWGYALSAAACLLLVALLVLRRPGPAAIDPAPPAPASREAAAWPLRRAALAALGAAVVLGFVFALRAGVVLGPLVGFVLWRGIGGRALALAGGGLLALEPAIYLVFLPEDKGGYNFNYPVDLVGAHWVAVVAWVLLALALWRSLAGRGAHAPAKPVSMATPRTPAAEPAAASAARARP